MFAALPFVLQQMIILVVGLCMGSFFNVIIHRLPENQSLVLPGSHCPKCKHPLAFYDNIPLLSYVILLGKCRYCRAHISLRYPLVEALTGFLAVMLFRRYGLHPQFAAEFFFVSLLILVTFIDLDTFMIPDILSLTGVVVGFAFSFFTPRLSWSDSLVGILAGGGFLYLIAVCYAWLRRQEGLGGGDIKLLGMIGAFIGWQGVVFTVLVGSLVGMLIGMIVMIRTRKGLSTMLPFGPFLSLGAVCYLFWGQSFFAWYLGTFISR